MDPRKTNQIQQSAALPFLIKNDQLHIVLITSRRLKQWIIPKGNIEAGLTPSQSAKNEALEEAGIDGYIHNESVGTFTCSKNGSKFNVSIFPMHVRNILSEWDEMEFRKRKVVPVKEAFEMIHQIDVIKAIKRVIKNPSKYLEKL